MQFSLSTISEVPELPDASNDVYDLYFWVTFERVIRYDSTTSRLVLDTGFLLIYLMNVVSFDLSV